MENTIVKTTPKDFFLQLGVIITLYASVAAILTLLFQVINMAFPDSLEGSRYTYYDPYSPAVRMAIASLLVIFPVHILLSKILEGDYSREEGKRSLPIRRWLTYLTLFAAGIAIGVDLIILINTFLGGEITARFILKVLAVLVVFAFVFGYYIKDIRNNLTTSAKRIFAYGSSLVVLLSIVAGFAYIGSPAKHRSLRLDSERVSDLNSIQSSIINYWQGKEAMPKDLSEVNSSIMGIEMPADPESGAPYEYKLKSGTTFELCATFDRPTPVGVDVRYGYDYEYSKPFPGEAIRGGEDWRHGAGRYCFERTIDPDFFPPINVRND